MLKTNSLLTYIIAVLLLSGCSSTQKIAALKPEPDDASPLVYENAVSFIDLPITIKLKDIENQTNKFMTGLVYEDNNITDDDIEMKIWKLAPIQIQNENGKIKTVLPLKATIKYRIGTDRLGVDLYNVREFNLNGNVTLISDVGLTNWKMTTATNLKSLDWNESPTTIVFGKNVPITYLINPTIKLFKSKIEKSIDNAIAKSMDFKPNVLDALEKICQPFEMSETYQSWLRVVPIELYTTDAEIKKENINLEMGMKCLIETLVGQKPASKFDRTAIVLKPVAKMPNQITANIVAISTYDDASKIMTKNFAGQEFGSGSRKVTVQNVAIWHKDGKMVIALDMLGSLNGTIYLAGFPQYNNETKEIFFDKLDYALDTKSRLVRTANWLMSGYVLKKIQESCRYSIKPNLEEGKQNMQKYLKNYSPMPGVFVNGVMDDIQFQKIQLTNKAIIAFVKVNGNVNVNVDGLK
ncbi:MAG TPA: DUF4403 family protein [Flavobacterium sp.]|nr:DUF4403 family protein [Flavobacterium sp.]